MLEVNPCGQSTLEEASREYSKVKYHKIYSGELAKERVTQYPGCYLHGVFPTKVWSPAEWAKAARLGPEYTSHLSDKRARHLGYLTDFMKDAAFCLEKGGNISFAFPTNDSIWLQHNTVHFIHIHNLPPWLLKVASWTGVLLPAADTKPRPSPRTRATSVIATRLGQGGKNGPR